jgi:hypothetical protein
MVHKASAAHAHSHPVCIQGGALNLGLLFAIPLPMQLGVCGWKKMAQSE